MRLIALKPCSFGGINFYIGDPIPAELVLDPKMQAQMGVLAIVDESGEPVVTTQIEKKSIRVVDLTVNGEHLSVTVEGLQAFVDAVTANASDAEAIIEQITDGDALILLHCVDGRKAVKAAAETRAKSLLTEEGEQ